MTIRTAAAIVGIIIITATDVSAEDKPGWLHRTFGELTWEEVATTVETPREIARAVRRRVDYTDDLVDQWQTGEDTWKKATGDCEDFAVAVLDLCKTNGIDAKILILQPVGSYMAHAVVVGTYRGRLWVSSNGWYKEFKSMDAAIKDVSRDFAWRGKEIRVSEVDKPGALGYPRFVRIARA